MFETLPSNFFNLKITKNRDLYVSALFVLRKAVKQDLYLTRDDLLKRITAALDKKIDEADFDEDGKFDQEDLSTTVSKAHFIIRKLRDYGWINIDFNTKNSFEEYIAIPAYSTIAINFLYALTEEAENEYNSLVYSVYAALKMADSEGNDYYDALLVASKNTEKLNESLANLYYGVRSIEQRIADNIDINDVVHIHFNEYITKLHDRYYHPYKTFDSIQRFRSPIIKILKNWQNSSIVRRKMIENAKSKLPNKKNDEIFEYITELYNSIIYTYEGIEEKMEIIDNKINEYTASSIDKMKHLLSIDESYKGKITYLIKVLNDNKDLTDDLVDLINENLSLSGQEYATEDGLYTKREITIMPETAEVEIFVEDKFGEDVTEMFDKIKLGYNLNKIKEFIIDHLQGNKEIEIKDMHIQNDEEFILSILAMLRGDEKELPFKVEFNEGYVKSKNYLLPNIKFVLKEGKR